MLHGGNPLSFDRVRRALRPDNVRERAAIFDLFKESIPAKGASITAHEPAAFTPAAAAVRAPGESSSSSSVSGVATGAAGAAGAVDVDMKDAKACLHSHSHAHAHSHSAHLNPYAHNLVREPALDSPSPPLSPASPSTPSSPLSAPASPASPAPCSPIAPNPSSVTVKLEPKGGSSSPKLSPQRQPLSQLESLSQAQRRCTFHHLMNALVMMRELDADHTPGHPADALLGRRSPLPQGVLPKPPMVVELNSSSEKLFGYSAEDVEQFGVEDILGLFRYTRKRRCELL